jgi:hypothetical protein
MSIIIRREKLTIVVVAGEARVRRKLYAIRSSRQAPCLTFC